ncbi:hypothetical protein BJ944DRAFT_267753 [Cunninghamella echinulata]|nr:hypothetical protein BJ944DRAFT_267753 [Cunninghamella echinulata]
MESMAKNSKLSFFKFGKLPFHRSRVHHHHDQEKLKEEYKPTVKYDKSKKTGQSISIPPVVYANYFSMK